MRSTEYSLMIVTVVLTIVQIAWPSSRSLPWIRIGGERANATSREEISKRVSDLYSKSQLSVLTATKHFDASLEEAGITIESMNTAKKAISYPMWQRLIPFSSVVISLKRNMPPVITYDDAKVQSFANRVSREGAVASVNAKIVADNGKAKLVPAQPSQTYPASHTVQVLRKFHFNPKTTIRLTAQTAPADRTDKEVETHIEAAQRAIDTPLTLTFESQTAQPDKKTIGSWLAFTEPPTTHKLQIALKQDAVSQYLRSVESKTYKAPGVTKIHTIDDREVDRATGDSGYGILLDKAFVSINTAIHATNKTTLPLSTGTLEPTIEYNRQYSNTDHKLMELLQTVQNAHSNYGISVMELDGRSGNLGGDKQFEAASTYKLFVAYSVLKAIDDGKLHWTDSSAGGRTVEKCFEDMIILSDNACPVDFKSKLGGWQVIETQTHDLGLSTRTKLTGSVLLTTANDLSYFLYRLQNGTLLSAADSDRLLNLMKHQIYRSGIPAGTSLVVADKVGFVDNVIHDAGIVYSATRPYVLVIMTSDSSWTGIADSAQAINAGL